MLIGFVSFTPYPQGANSSLRAAQICRDWAEQLGAFERFDLKTESRSDTCEACDQVIDRDGHCRCI